MLQIESDVGKGLAVDVKEAKELAAQAKATWFKLYNRNGYFIGEYARFDGKYREVIA